MTAPNPAPTATPGPQGPALPGSQWARLHPLSPILRSWRVLGIVAAISAQDGVRRGGFSGLQLLITVVVVIPLSAIGGYLSWRRRRWRVEGGDLRLDYGIITRKSRRVPLARLQAIDVVRPLLARALGLAELRLEVVGHGSSEATLAYLTEAHALQVRAYLLDLAHRPAGGAADPIDPANHSPPLSAPAPGRAPAAPAAPVIPASAGPSWGPDDEALLTAVPPGRFVASLILSAAGGVSALFVVAVLVAVLVAPAGAGAIATGLLPIGAAIYRRFTVEFGFTVSLSPQGVRLRHGLLDTRQQTVPRGRVQALRIVEPLLWRQFGWLRVEVDVAGYRGGGASGASERSSVGVLLPVGLRAEVEGVIHSVLPGLDLHRLATERPPLRARWRAPLSYHNLGAALDAGFSVTTYGRISRVTDVVPQDKLQSVRLVQGPVQRKLRLASVHLDTAGRNVHAAIRHWDVGQA
ncbi:MAG: rane-flanked domain protein, partial [Mycobacterium sp.]|nr:rane-flanked domain protein [Mycobacterium sp.]